MWGPVCPRSRDAEPAVVPIRIRPACIMRCVKYCFTIQCFSSEIDSPVSRGTPARRRRRLSPAPYRPSCANRGGCSSWRCFAFLALILATYHKTDPGVVVHRQRRRARRTSGGIVGAWLADVLLYLFGLSAWWWVVGRRGAAVSSATAADRRSESPRPTRNRIRLARSPGFLPRAPCQRRARGAAALSACRSRCRSHPGGALGDTHRQRRSPRRSASTARRCC